MSRTDTLRDLESLLEGFLDRVVTIKEKRLDVLDGINRIDDIARGFQTGEDLTDETGQWFAQHRQWLSEGALRPTDRMRIGRILEGIRSELRVTGPDSPAAGKISDEIERWQQTDGKGGRKIVLERHPEVKPTAAPPLEAQLDSIGRFDEFFEHMLARFRDFAGEKHHILSVLDDSLRSAEIQANKEALILSAAIIYYLKQENYRVEPYVRRLKRAEKAVKGEAHA